MTTKSKTKYQIHNSDVCINFKVVIKVSIFVGIENRIYIREELKESLGMNFLSPF